MRLLRKRPSRGAAALAEPDGFPGSDADLNAEIERLSEQNRASRDPGLARQILELRHLAGIRLMDAHAGEVPSYPEPDFDRLPEGDPLPELSPQQLTPERLRAAILRDGCMLVRGLLDREWSQHFAREIQRAYDARERFEQEGGAPPDLYDEFELHPRFDQVAIRGWIKSGGGLLAADAPRACIEMLDVFRSAGLPALVDGFLGERGIISVEKTTLRKADPSIPGGWHQDGRFMGEVRALNLWIALSRCGDEAPGLDFVPRRLDHFLTTATDEAVLDSQVSRRNAEEAAGDLGILRPIFDPGDALLFDDRFLHATAADPDMPNPRYAIESWFFGGSAFPGDYAPIAV